MSDYIQHFSHEHPLKLGIWRSSAMLTCGLCQLSICDDQSHRCKECDYFIHKACAELPKHIDHSLHPQHNALGLAKRSLNGTSTICYYCENSFGDQEILAYICDMCSLLMHITCALIPIPTVTCDNDQDTGVVQYVCHQNPMTLVEDDNFKREECAFLGTTVECQSHDHLLSFVEKAVCDIRCDACEKSYTRWRDHLVPNEVYRTKSFLFRCMECDFNLHFLCGPVPTIITYEYHIHPLTLVDHYVPEDDLSEYYCDACEEERNSHFRVYQCEDCKYTAHIHCLIYEVS
ncbi:Zinc finger, PHD-type, conserved site [Trema orientale]|uniref:Zinc finger, PHD-type, conserved site n=1 Tax=Trema orientale TaxID=63057 RepID=A0A2P5FK12_TREOI|nr:Zinc finger, PHD-type, conserved site [Trema orientale]